MLPRTTEGYRDFIRGLRDLITTYEIFTIFEDYEFSDSFIEIPTSIMDLNGNNRPVRFRTLRDIFDYPFRQNTYQEYRKYIFACFVYSYLRYSEKKIYFDILRYSEITDLTDGFNIDQFRNPQQMMSLIQNDPILYPTINQLNFDLQVKLVNLLQEIAGLFNTPIQGFSINDIQDQLHNTVNPNKFQDYFHDVTKLYFNYNQMYAIKTFKDHKNYLRAVSLSHLVDISNIDENVLKVLGKTFYNDINYFNLRSNSNENKMINFFKVSEILLDMSNSINIPIHKIRNFIEIAAYINLNQVLNLF
jgi:hypothetical protein